MDEPRRPPGGSAGAGLIAAELAELAQCLVPGGVGVIGAVHVHAGQGVGDERGDGEEVRSLVRGDLDLLGHVGVDLTDGGVVEELVLVVQQGRVVQGVNLRGEVALGLEGLDLLLGGGQPVGQGLGLGLVLALGGNGQVGAAPVAAATGEDRSHVPALDAGRVALDHAEHPRRAQHRGEAVILEGVHPVLAPLRQACGQAGLRLVEDRVVGVADGGVVLQGHDGVVVALEGVLDLVEHALVGARSTVVPRDAGGVDELLADLEVAVPVALEELGDLVAVGGQVGLGEEVGAVAQGLRAGVGAVADELTVLGGGRAGLPLGPAVLDGVRGQVHELVGVLHELGQPVHLDRLDV